MLKGEVDAGLGGLVGGVVGIVKKAAGKAGGGEGVGGRVEKAGEKGEKVKMENGGMEMVEMRRKMEMEMEMDGDGDGWRWMEMEKMEKMGMRESKEVWRGCWRGGACCRGRMRFHLPSVAKGFGASGYEMGIRVAKVWSIGIYVPCIYICMYICMYIQCGDKELGTARITPKCHVHTTITPPQRVIK
jgi:hypothetical protein